MKKVPIEKVCVFYQPHILSEGKGWQKQACHQLEKAKPIYLIQPFENGKSTFNKRYLEEGQLYVPVRPQGRIFLHPL